nr:right-handed parallel beta-helix repeat-containing protein [Methanobacterium spitsbergense]
MFKPSNGAALENNRGTLTLNHCVFVNSQAAKDGGVIYNNGSLYMNRCLVNNNLGGSGIYTAGSGTVNIRNSSIFYNINEDGIGITVESGNPTITGNNIYGNFWRGIYIMGGNAVISNNNIHNNGHGTCNGDGIWINGGNPVITSNNIRNNSEDGIHIDRSSKDNSKSNKLNIHYNSIVDNGKCGLHVVNHVYVNAIHNWWGTNSPDYVRQIIDPIYPKDIFEQYDNPSINHISWNPYLYLRIKSNSPIYNGNNSTVTAYLTRDNRKDNKINLAPGTVPDGTTVTFSLTNGTYGRLTEPFTRTTVGGVSTIVFTANDPNAQNVSATVDHQQVTTEIYIKPQARVVMSIKSNSPAHVGGIGQFIVTLTNYGPDIAYRIIVQEHNLLPDFIHELSEGCYDILHGRWTVFQLENGETVTLTAYRIMNKEDLKLNWYDNVTESQFTHNPTPIKQKTALIKTRTAAEVSMTKTSNGSVHVGQTGTFTITLINKGPNDATNVLVRDPFQAGFTYTPSIGSYDRATGIWCIDKLANRASATLTISKVMSPTDVGTIHNTAYETQETYNPSPIIPQTANLTVNPVAYVVMTKTSNGPVHVGETGTFTITLKNNGPNDATNVLVSDPYITGFLYMPSTGSYNFATGIWTISRLANGATATLTITKVMSTNDIGTIHNTASETQTTYNPTPITPQTANLTVNPSAHVIMTKTSNGPVHVGQRGIFTITLTNNGPSDATNVLVSDPFIVGFTYTPSIGSYDPTTGIWTISRLANGATATLTITKVMSTNDIGTIHNTASETQTTYNPTPITPQTANLTVNPSAHVIMTKTSNGPVHVGQRGIFTITLTNNGPSDATNVLVSDPFIVGFTYTPSIGSYDPTTGIWTISRLANGATATLTITKVMSTNDIGTIHNTASETQTTYNPTPITPQTANLTVNPSAHVIMTKTSNGPVHVGQRGIFTITLTNNGPSDATNVLVSDPYIKGFTYTPSIGTYNPTTGIWAIRTLVNGAAATLTISKHNMAPSDVGTIHNTASETQTTYNPTPITPQTANLTVNPSAHVIMTKTSNGPVHVGQRGIFTITLTNNGPSDATNVLVSDPYIKGFTYTPSIGTYNPTTGIWAIRTLVNGAAATLTISKHNMAPSDVGTIHNTASETQTTYNPTPITPQTANLTVNPSAHVIMTKTSNGPVHVGQRGIFTITLTNNGPSDATNVLVSDPFIVGFTYTPSIGSYDPTTGIWTISRLANGATATLTITKVMSTNDIGTIHNTASETQTTYNPTPITPQTATLYIYNVKLSIKKTSNKTKYNAGDSVVYNIDVKNNGSDTATNIIVTDTLRSGLTYISSTLGGSYNALTRTVTWKLASLTSGLHFLPSFTASVNKGTQGHTITNTVSAYNNGIKTPIISTPANIKVNKAVLSIKKTSGKTKYNTGNSVFYIIDVKNNGPDTATNIIVTDTLPTGMIYVDSTRGGVWDYTKKTVTWNVDNLARGAHFKAMLTANINIHGGKTLKNRVQAIDKQMNSPVSATKSIHVKKSSLYVKVSPTIIQTLVGKTFTITYKVGNKGPDEANNVVMSFVIPKGLRFVSASSKDGAKPSYNAATKELTWILGDVKVGDPILKLNVKALRAGTFLITSKLVSSTTSRQQAIVSAVTVKAHKKAHNKVKPHGGQTIPMQKTGAPIGALILAGLMILGGILLPRQEN